MQGLLILTKFFDKLSNFILYHIYLFSMINIISIVDNKIENPYKNENHKITDICFKGKILWHNLNQRCLIEIFDVKIMNFI